MTRLKQSLYESEGAEAFMPDSPDWVDLPWSKNLSQKIPDEVRALAQGIDVYMVGGVVRDALLQVKGTDLDAVVSYDDWKKLPGEAEKSGWRIQVRDPSLTAVLTTRRGQDTAKLEVACLRRDQYEAGGILMVTDPADFCHDALRRDATLNAMYLRVRDGKIWDPFRAAADPCMEVVHPGTLIEDPLRAIRIWRFAQVLKIPIESETVILAAQAAAHRGAELLNPPRLRSELDRAARQSVLGPLLTTMANHSWPRIPVALSAGGWAKKSEKSMAKWCSKHLSVELANALSWIWQ